jgi:hypothetical protein
LVIAVFGRQIWKQCKTSETTHSKRPEPESDLLLYPPPSP